VTDDPGDVVRRALARLSDAHDATALLDPGTDRSAAAMLGRAGVEPGTPDWLAGAWYLWARFQAIGTGRVAHDDLQAACALFAPVHRTAPAHLPAELAAHFRTEAPPADELWQVHDAALALLPLALRTRERALADRCVRLLQHCVANAGDAADRRVMLCNLAKALHDRFELTGDAADQDASIEAVRESVRLTPAGSEHLPSRWTNLALALRGRFDRTGEQAALDEAIGWGERALAATPPAGPERPRIIANVAPLLAARFELAGNSADLDAAVTLLEAAVGGDRSDPRLAGRLTNLAEVLRMRAEHTGRIADMDAAVDAARGAVALDPDGPLTAANLAVALRTRHQRTGQARDLADALDSARQAVATTHPDSPDLSVRLSGLGLTFGAVAAAATTAEADRTAALEEAVGVSRAALDMLPAGHPLLARRRANLGSLLLARFHRSGDHGDLADAIDELERAREGLPEQHLDRATVRSNLDVAMLARFARTGDTDDLDRAVEEARAALDATPAGSIDRAGRLSNLGVALTERFDVIGARRDLDDAVAAVREAVAATRDDDPFTAGVLLNLAAVLRGLGDRTDDPHLTDQAVETAERAIAAAPGAHPDRAAALSNLAGALLSRHVRTAAADLDAAVGAARAALAGCPPGAPAAAPYGTNLAALLRRQHDTDGGHESLDEALDVVTRALARHDTAAPERARCLLERGAILRRRWSLTGDRTTLDQAVAQFREAFALPGAPTRLRVRAAAWWGECAAIGREWADADQGFGSAVELIGRLTGPRLARTDHEYELAGIGGLACDAAAAALHAGHPERAVGLSELGRGVLLGRALDSRTDLTDLGGRSPQLAARFVALRAALGTSERPVASPRDRVAAEAAMRDLLEEIRTLPGHSGFLRPPSIDDLTAATGHGPAVILNASRYRCDALVLRAGRVTVVPLPQVTTAELADRARDWWVAVEALGDAADAAARESLEHSMTRTLAWLGEEVVRPVLDAIPDVPQRMWWCPTGLFGYLPLHAAGPAAGPIASMTPSVRALVHGRPSRTGFGLGSAVVVAMTQTPGAADLPGSSTESAIVTAALSGPVAVLDAGHATRDRLLDVLPRHRIAHFACHAVADPDDPSSGRLLLRDRPLTVADIDALDLRAAGLAVLSACGTAAPAGALVDEAIQLASAFRIAGYRQVVATLWPVPDPVAVRFARVLYRELARADTLDGVPAAWSAAVAALRQRWPDHPSAWAAFVHIGQEPGGPAHSG
jgi:tetratricopeptide (TPR) repeat protein